MGWGQFLELAVKISTFEFQYPHIVSELFVSTTHNTPIIYMGYTQEFWRSDSHEPIYEETIILQVDIFMYHTFWRVWDHFSLVINLLLCFKSLKVFSFIFIGLLLTLMIIIYTLIVYKYYSVLLNCQTQGRISHGMLLRNIKIR